MSNDEPWVYDPEEWAGGNSHAVDGNDYTQIVLDEDHILHGPILNLLHEEGHGTHWPAPMYLVTEGRWSGYSEYTITSTWTEVHVHHGEVDLHFDDMGEFMRRLAAANPPGSNS